VFTPQQAERISCFLQPYLEKYSFVDTGGQIILCWDHARFINHSCEPTTLSTGFSFEVAVRDIHPGEELTDDYASLNLARNFECRCRSLRCRHIIHPGDFLKYAADWDGVLTRVFPLIKSVEQPLWPLVQEKTQVESALTGETPIPSVLVHYWDRKL